MENKSLEQKRDLGGGEIPKWDNHYTVPAEKQRKPGALFENLGHSTCNTGWRR